MPNWKKVIVSGSDATLNSLYAANSVTASIFSGSFTGSLAGTASWANNAISSSYAITASYALNGSGGGLSALYIQDEGVTQGTASYINFTGTGVTATVSNSTASISITGGGSGGGGAVTYHQTASAVTWSVNHSLNTYTPIVQVYDENYNQLVPASVSGSSVNAVQITFSTATAGYAVITTGGLTITGSNAFLFQSTPATTWSFYHGLNETYPVFTIFDSNDDVIIPLKIHAENANTASIYFSTARTGTAVAANCGLSGSTFESASYSAYAVSASFAQNTATSSYILNAVSASYATNALSASFANNATNANTASFVTLAQTASYVLNAVSASYATFAQNASTASYVLNAVSASWATSASRAVSSLQSSTVSISGVSGNQEYTFVLVLTGSSGPSMGLNTDTVTGVIYNPSTNLFRATNMVATGSLLGTASFADNATSSSYALAATSASYALTASFASVASASQNAEDIIVYVQNNSGTQINKGDVVRISGAVGDNPQIALADWTNDANSANTLGLAMSNIPDGGNGYVMTEGRFRGYDTSTPGWTAGQLLYLGPSGSITGSAPQAPLHGVRLGQVLRVQQINGSIYLRIDNGVELGELHDVRDTTTTASFGDLLVKSGSVWTNSRQLTGSYSLTGSLQATSLTGSVQVSGNSTYSGSQTFTTGYIVLTQVSQSLNYEDDAAAASGGVPLGGLYRNGNFIAIRIV